MNEMTNKYLVGSLNNENDSTCLRPCKTISYKATFRKMHHNSRTLSDETNEIKDWIGFGLVYGNVQVTTNHEYYVMSKEALVSSIGGFLGMFLGFSSLSIINWLFNHVNQYYKNRVEPIKK